MKEKVFETIKKYSDAGIRLEPETIEELVSILVKDFKLNNYVNNVVFNEPKTSTSYSPFNKNLYFDYTWENGDKINNTYINNILYLYELLHELTHASQFKLVNENEYSDFSDPFDKYKYRLTFDFYRYINLKDRHIIHGAPSEEELEFASYICHNKDNDFASTLGFFYFLFHDSFIGEREADVEAYKYIIDLLKTYDSNTNITQYFENKLRNKLLYLYSFDYSEPKYSPLQDYLEHFGYDSLKSDLDALKKEIKIVHPDLSLETRMEYGLDVLHKEFFELKNYVVNERDKRLFKNHSIIK